MKTSLKDIAETLKLSKTTISWVLSFWNLKLLF